MTTARCITCTRLRLKGVPTAKLGFGRCASKPAWELVSVAWTRACDMHVAADGPTQQARRDWARTALGMST